MKYQISQKLFSIGDDFSICDEYGKPCYLFDGKGFSIGKKISVKDANGTEVAFISQKLISHKPSFKISQNGTEVATIYKKFLSFRPQFVIDVPGPNDYKVIGDFIGHEYTIKRNKKDIARVSKKYFSVRDSYGVNITEGEDVFILAAVVIIDLVLYNDKK